MAEYDPSASNAPIPTTRAPTIREVAAMAGVSTMTVSNVLNATKNVQASTRDAVLAAVEALGYRPNSAARNLARSEHFRIGLLYRNPENAFLGSLLVGTLRATTRLSAQLVIQPFESENPKAVVVAVKKLIAGGMDGLLLPPPLCEFVNDSEIMARSTIPIMGIAPGGPLSNMASVRIDDRAAMRVATQKLLDLGHRRIGFIRGPRLHRAAATRQDGYNLALHDAGLSLDPALVVEGNFDFDSGLIAAERLLALATPPTAIIASNDDMAAAVVSVAHRRQIIVPQQLSIIGFDDTPISHKIWPRLATVRQPISAMAELAAETIVAVLRARKAGVAMPLEDRFLEYTFLERESLAPVQTPPAA